MIEIKPNTRIGIIGGGPAGAMCAIFLSYYSRRENVPVSLTIYEGKYFEDPGVKGCNLCVGILAHSLLERLSELGLEVPARIVQRKIDSYRLVTEIGGITLEKDERRRIYTVYRGGGPKGFKFVNPISFDNFLLNAALAQGVSLRKCTVVGLKLPRSHGEPYVLEGRCGRKYEEDVLIGAFGVNSALKHVFADLGFGYRPPRTSVAYQAEFHLGEEFIDDKLQNSVLVYLLPLPRLDFGLVVPKRSQVTVSIVGRRLRREDVDGFLSHPLVRKAFPPGWQPAGDYCYCAPHLPITPAVRPYRDRMVIIGDASISRYYKNGIQSAYFTASFAARNIFYHGLRAGDFRRYYWRECRRKYLYDNLYGRVLFLGSNVIKRSHYLSRVMLNVADGRWASESSHAARLRRVYWNMFTGNAPYYYICRDLFNLGLQFDLLRASLNPLGRQS